MKHVRLFLFVGMAWFSNYLLGQELQKILPLSPNSAALAKFIETPVGTFTGVTPINIPIYHAKSRELEWPLVLSYHAGGNKVETIATSVGLGWTINTVPTISRVVRGIPDEGTGGFFSKYYGKTVFDLYEYREGNPQQRDDYLNFLRAVNEGIADPEPDIFLYNIAGKSGKFYFDQQFQSFLTYPYENIKIDFNDQRNSFQIIDDNGLKYDFDIKETHYVSTINPATSTTVSWLASDVINANNTDSINFDYRLEVQFFRSSNSVTRYFKYESTGNCSNAPEFDYENLVTNTLYHAYCLEKIRFANGQVTFEADPQMREDLNGGYALKSIKVFTSSGEIVKNFELSYSYLSSQTSGYGCYGDDNREKKWLILSYFKDINVTSGNHNDYSFDYNQNNTPPCRLSTAQDHWGYYNGQLSNVDLLPTQVLTVPQTTNTFRITGANRSVNTTFSQFGILTKITYPTGGATDYEYEQNESHDAIVPSEYSSLNAAIEGEEVISTNHYNNTFNINNLPDHYLNGNNVNGGAFVNVAAGNFGCELNGISSTCANVTIRGTSSGNANFFMTVTGNSNNIYLPNGTYLMDAKFDQDPPQYNSFYLVVTWQVLAQGSGDENKKVGGLRIKKIRSSDGISTGNDIIHTYKYTTTLEGGESSGKVFGNSFFNYVEPFTQVYRFSDPVQPNLIHICTKKYLKVTSVSNIQAVSHSGSFTGYSKVFTMNGDQGAYGVTEQSFTNVADEVSSMFPYPPTSISEHLRGLPISVTEYKLNGSLLKPVRQTFNTYNEQVKHVSFCLKVANNIIYQDGPGSPFVPVVPEGIGSYYINSSKCILTNKTEKVYDAIDATKFTEVVTHNDYNSSTLQLSSYSIVNSKNKTTKTNIFYPSDLLLTGTAESARLSLLDQNRVNVSLKKQTLVDSNIIEEIVTNYSKVNIANIVMPDNIIVQRGNAAAEMLVKFSKYSDEGNLIEQQKINNLITSYIWGYNQTYPIAEVVNSEVKDIFHTSFEEGDGNSAVGDSRTGEKSKTNGYSMSLSGLTNQGYTLTYWKKSGSTWVLQTSNVNVTTGSYSIALTGQIDEVRFYPSTAQMTTYTYKPLVGMTSQCDANNRIAYYEYDNFGRLKIVKDQDGKIIKAHDYRYQQ